MGREVIFNLTMGNESVHQVSNDNGVRIVNSATSKSLVVKTTKFPNQNSQRYTWTPPDGKTHNQIDHILIVTRCHSSILNLSGDLIVILIIIRWLQNLGKNWQ